MFFKSRNGLAPQYLFDLFAVNSSDSSYNLRSTANDLKLPKKISSNLRSSKNIKRESDDLPKIPRVLVERSIKSDKNVEREKPNSMKLSVLS